MSEYEGKLKSLTVRVSPALMETLRKEILKRKHLDYSYSLNQFVGHAIIEKLKRDE